MDQWTTVLFTNEYRLSFNNDSHRMFIWRESGSHYLPYDVREIDHYGGGGLIIWAGIMLDDRTLFHVFERGTMIAKRYRDEVSEF